MGEDLTRVERYLAHLDGLSGGVEPEFYPVESTWPGHKGVTAIVYRDQPEEGMVLGFTYGLSHADHEEWLHGKPELSICVKSDDVLWALAIAHLAESLRHDCPFSYGDTIHFGGPVSHASAMDSFVVFAPIALDRADAQVDVGDHHPVNIVGMYPIYSEERAFIREMGLEAFWQLDWDPCDVSRQPAI